MTNGFREGEPKPWPETAEEHAARLKRERDMLEVGREDIRAGRFIEGAELEAFLDWFASDSADPPPGRSK